MAHFQSYSSNPAYGNSEPLAFFGSTSAPSSSNSPYYPGSRSSLEGHMGSSSASYPSGSMGRSPGFISSEGKWWEAFGTGGFDGEPSLMEGE